MFFEISQNEQENTCTSLYCNKVTGLRPFNFQLWHRCFPVNFAKFQRKPFLQNTSGWVFFLIGILTILLPLILRHILRKSFSKWLKRNIYIAPNALLNLLRYHKELWKTKKKKNSFVLLHNFLKCSGREGFIQRSSYFKFPEKCLLR